MIDLVYSHDKSVDQLAGIAGVPAYTVKTRVFHAARLQTMLPSAGLDGV